MSESKFVRSTGLYFEEFIPGESITSMGRTITEADVVGFASLSGDWNLIHTNTEYSKEHMFGQRVAHGLLILSIASGLAVRMGFMEETILAFRSIGEWKFQRPVFIGDTVRVRLTVGDMKAMPRLDGGLVNFDVEVLNHEDKVVQRGNWEMLVKAREES